MASARASTTGMPALVAIWAAWILVVIPPVPIAEPMRWVSTFSRSTSGTKVIGSASGSSGWAV